MSTFFSRIFDIMYEIFEKLIKEKRLRAADITRLTGIKSTVFSEWKKGKSTPKYDKLQKIADCLGVTVEYLTTGEDSRFPIPDFDPKHLELIELYEKLSEDNKVMILDLMNKLGGN